MSSGSGGSFVRFAAGLHTQFLTAELGIIFLLPAANPHPVITFSCYNSNRLLHLRWVFFKGIYLNMSSQNNDNNLILPYMIRANRVNFSFGLNQVLKTFPYKLYINYRLYSI